MTALSKSEPWEARSLKDLKFTKEPRSDYDGNVVDENANGSGARMADKDVAVSIYNLRKMLQGEDFKKVFDSRNRFIGEID